MTATRLETLQEVVTLVVLAVCATWYWREPMRWNIVVGFVLIAAGAGFVFAPWARIFPEAEPVPLGAPAVDVDTAA